MKYWIYNALTFPRLDIYGGNDQYLCVAFAEFVSVTYSIFYSNFLLYSAEQREIFRYCINQRLGRNLTAELIIQNVKLKLNSWNRNSGRTTALNK